MRFDHASGDLQLVWNTFLDFEAFTREADGDLNYFIEEWKEKMVRVQSAGCQYSELLLGLKLLEKVNLSSDSIMSIISKLGSSHFNSDSFLIQVVTNLQAERVINGSPVDNIAEKNNQFGTNKFNHIIAVELDIKSNSISCSHCPDKFFDAVSLSKHYQQFHPIQCDKNFYLKEDIGEHQNSNDNDVPLESFVQVWGGSPERNAENPKDGSLMPDEIKMEINCVLDFGSDIKNVQADNQRTSKEFMCFQCGMQFQNRAALSVHKTKHHKKEMSKQGETRAEAVTDASLKSGLINRQIKTLNIIEGIQMEGIENTATDDNLSFSPENKVPCKTCGKVIAKTSMSRHIRLHRNEVFKCWICQKEFKLPQYLKEHLETHKETKDHICPYCSNAYQTKENLKKHLKKFCRKKNYKTDNNSIFFDKFQVKKVVRSLSEDTMNTITEKISGKKPFQIPGKNVEQMFKQKKINLKYKQRDAQSEAVFESNPKFGTANRQIVTLHKIKGIKKESTESPPTDDNLSLPENKVPCKTCGKFIVKTSMSRHIRLHRNEVFKCWICQKEFKLPQYLKEHLETHKETKDHICPYCSNAYQTKVILKKHLKKSCRKKLPKTDNNSHSEDMSPVEKEFKSFSEDAIKTETEESSGKNPSEVTGESMEEVVKQKETSDQNLKEGEGNIPCEICGKLINKHQMIKHIKVHRTSVQCQCEICGEVIEDRKMNLHLKTHNPQQKYKCSICQKQFKSSCHLKQHIETHNATNEYICSFCGKKYKTKMTLYMHINQHTKGKPLPCKFCDKIFYFYSARTFHIRAHHTGEKPYKCDICDERFYISTRKIQHMRKHTGEKPFSCEECGKKFSEAASLRKHMRTVHKEVKLGDM